MHPTVLLVDDERIILEGMKQALSHQSYRLFTAGSAHDALDVLGHEPIDVIVSDERMPGMSGIELIATVRKQYPDTIRMVLTGHATIEMAMRAVNDGEIHRFFLKPCSGDELAKAIREALVQRNLMANARTVVRVLDIEEEGL